MSTNPNPRPVAPANTPLPIQNFQLTKSDLEDPSLGRLNVMLQQVIQRVNAHSGVSGPTILPSGADVQGKTVTGLAAPTSPTDAISSGHADSQYGAASLSPQLDIGGSSALKGLTSLQMTSNSQATSIAAIQSTLAPGASGTVTLAKITGGGANGSLTFAGGIITGFTPPT